jgi:hypothetical protein
MLAGMAEYPWERIARTQRAAAGLFADAVSRLVDMGKTGVTRPDELVREVGSMATALGELAGSTARPLEALLTSQRQLAETMSAFAVLQRQLADLVETAAANHAAIVEALEMMSGPVVGVAQRLRGAEAADDAADDAGDSE